MNKNKKSTEIRISGELSGKILFLLIIHVFFRFLQLDPGSENHKFARELFLFIDMNQVGPGTIMIRQGVFRHCETLLVRDVVCNRQD